MRTNLIILLIMFILSKSIVTDTMRWLLTYRFLLVLNIASLEWRKITNQPFIVTIETLLSLHTTSIAALSWAQLVFTTKIAYNTRQWSIHSKLSLSINYMKWTPIVPNVNYFMNPQKPEILRCCTNSKYQEGEGRRGELGLGTRLGLQQLPVFHQ